MAEAPTTNSKSKARSGRKRAAGRLFVLEVNGRRIHLTRPDDSDRKTIVADCHFPDGIVIDAEAGHIHWTNMGSSPSTNDGSIERAEIDGTNRTIIVPGGGTFTPKQLHLEKKTVSSTGATAKGCG